MISAADQHWPSPPLPWQEDEVMAEVTSSPAPCLLVMRRQLDLRWPGRDRSSDGIMGDSSHQARRSDHNLGNAIDVTNSENGGPLAGNLAEAFRRQMMSATTGRITYIISENRIASAVSQWRWRIYGGPNPHHTHCHISIAAWARDVIRPWKLD